MRVMSDSHEHDNGCFTSDEKHNCSYYTNKFSHNHVDNEDSHKQDIGTYDDVNIHSDVNGYHVDDGEWCF